MNKSRGTPLVTPQGNASRNGRGMPNRSQGNKGSFAKQRQDQPNSESFKEYQDRIRDQLNPLSEYRVDKSRWESERMAENSAANVEGVNRYNISKPYRNASEQGRFRHGGGGAYQNSRPNSGNKLRGAGHHPSRGQDEAAGDPTDATLLPKSEDSTPPVSWTKTPIVNDIGPKSEEEEKRMLEQATLNSLEEQRACEVDPECDPQIATSDSVKLADCPPSEESTTRAPTDKVHASESQSVSDGTTAGFALNTGSRPKNGGGTPNFTNTRKQVPQNKGSSYGATNRRVSSPSIAALSNGGGDFKDQAKDARPTGDSHDASSTTQQSCSNGGGTGSNDAPSATPTTTPTNSSDVLAEDEINRIAPRFQNGSHNQYHNRRASSRHMIERPQSSPSVDRAADVSTTVACATTTTTVDLTSAPIASEDELVVGKDPPPPTQSPPDALASKASIDGGVSPSQSKSSTINQGTGESIAHTIVHGHRPRTDITRPVYTILQPQLPFAKSHISYDKVSNGGNGLLPTPSMPQSLAPTTSQMLIKQAEDSKDEEIRHLKHEVARLNDCISRLQLSSAISGGDALPQQPMLGQLSYGGLPYGLQYGPMPIQCTMGVAATTTANANAYSHQAQSMLYSYSVLRPTQQQQHQQQPAPPPTLLSSDANNFSSDSSGELTSDVAIRQAIIAVEKDSSQQQPPPPSYPPSFTNGPPPTSQQQSLTVNGGSVGQQWHGNQQWQNLAVNPMANDSRLSATATPFSPRPPYDVPPSSLSPPDSLQANYGGYSVVTSLPNLVAQQQQQVSNAVNNYQSDAYGGGAGGYGVQPPRNGSRGAIDNGCYRRYDESAFGATSSPYCYGSDGHGYHLVQPAYASGGGIIRGPTGQLANDYSGFVTAPPFPGNEALFNYQQPVPVASGYDPAKPILYGAGPGRAILSSGFGGAGRPPYQVRQRGRGRAQQGNGPRF